MNLHKIAKDIYYLSYAGNNNDFRKSKIQEIEDWLADAYIDETETIEQLHSAWEAYEEIQSWENDDEYPREIDQFII